MVERSWAVDDGGVALVVCVSPVVFWGGCVWFSSALLAIWGCCVLPASLLLLLGGRGHLLGSYCRSWMAQIMSVGGLHVMLHGGDVVAKRTWVVIGWCVAVVGGVAGMVVVD